MNPKIQELAEQAGLNLELQSLKVELFAQLIVKECRPWLADDAFEEIKKHFGVEE